MTLTAHPLSLEGLDTLEARDLLLFVGADERPLRGLAGLTDWRLCGALTRLLRRSLFSGSTGETLLTIGGGRLPVERIFLYGLGQEEPTRAFERALPMIAEAKGSDLALAPFPAGGEEPVRIAGEVAELGHRLGLSRITFLTEELPAVKKALVVVEAHNPWARLENVI